MGLFKQKKDRRASVASTPNVTANVTKLDVRSGAGCAPHPAGRSQTPPFSDAGWRRGADGLLDPDGDTELPPIAGVSLELYSEIARSVAFGDDPHQMFLRAAARGMSVPDWEEAVDGWNARILSRPTIARLFVAYFRRD